MFDELCIILLTFRLIGKQVLVLKACRLYNTFGSGAIHSIYAQFMAQSAIHNKGRKIGLLRGATTRFATWFYAMMRLLRMKDVLMSTVHAAQFKEVEKTDVVSSAIKDINDPKFFKAMYIVLRAVYPAIRVLRYCDKGEPCMDKLYYLTSRATDAINRSKEFLNDPVNFQFEEDITLVMEEQEIYGAATANEDDTQIEPEFSDEEEDAPESDEEESENESTSAPVEEVQPTSFWGKVSKAWDERSKKLEHDWSITGWALSVMPEVYVDARARLTGPDRDAIERVVRKLMTYPYPNKFPHLEGKSEDDIVDLFWDEFKSFSNKTAPFDRPARWNSESARMGKSWIWHEKYSRPHTKVLGIIACEVTSKNLGMGPCERNWGGVKGIKTGNKVRIRGDNVNKRAIIYTSALVNEARMRKEAQERTDARGCSMMFSDDDMK